MIKQGRQARAGVEKDLQIWILVPGPRGRRPARWFAAPVGGQTSGMRFGNVEVRPLGGGLGCLFMVLFSVVASVVLTVLVNLLMR
jgi:hypothetical protein